MNWKTNVLNFFFPRTCGVCGEDVRLDEPVVCDVCEKSFPRWEDRSCRVCGLPLPDGGARCFECQHRRRTFRFCRSAGLYEGTLRAAILKMKYGGRDALADPLGEALAQIFLARREFQKTEALIPVPLHFIKRHARGYNQSQLLAESLAKRTGLPVWNNLLVRSRWGRAQARCDRKTRLENVRNVFSVQGDGSVVKGRRLLLVDDVCTTGATLESCARVLREKGAHSVDALTLARDV